jgi:hypothetical protein
MNACFPRIAATGRWVQARVKTFVEQSIITRLRVAIVISCQKHNLESILTDCIYRISYKIAKKGKPGEMDLHLLKNDITGSEPNSKLKINSRYPLSGWGYFLKVAFPLSGWAYFFLAAFPLSDWAYFLKVAFPLSD